MKINAINNTNQKQQSFRGIPGQNLSKGLAEFMIEVCGSKAKASKELFSEQGFDFIKQLADIKVSSLKKIDPVIDLKRVEDSDDFCISASLSGIVGECGIHINPKKDVPAGVSSFDVLIRFAKEVAIDVQTHVMPFIGKGRKNNSIEESAKALTEWMYVAGTPILRQ